ncbi:CCA tRNA nucleotidyltransferase [Sneathiella marina]|uniref:CCA tRNA nucleotidyltransferase n=1 Tax=Sneathiella marina TaxID=2950108 RepID=A0ABY4W803_9PROT|nr:CCA tRNA nucleotidyltransferase [Sneathiella marina]USG61885.1 CCA tRNA nucleotidyltransferase [Sneathiella marina]
MGVSISIRDIQANPPDWSGWPEVKRVFSAISEVNGTARFVGGCVRDALLGITSDDIDICTDLTPIDTIDALERKSIRVIPTGLAHGTVTAVINKCKFEITTLRVDVQSHGRHADVRFTKDWYSDASRRDFTINAIYLDPTGEIFDPFEGISDLKDGRVRFIGNPEERIAEDRLRILRFFRFFARFGGNIPDKEALNACRKNAQYLESLSAERVQKELLQILAVVDPLPAVKLMAKNQILKVILPGAPNTSLLASLLSLPFDTDSIQRLACLLGGEPDHAARAAQKLKFSRKLENRLLVMCDSNDEALRSEHQKQTVLYRLGKQGFIDQALLYCSRKGDVRELETSLDLAENWCVPVFPISGSDLTELGVAPGPEMGQLLKKMEQSWVSSGFSLTKEILISEVLPPSLDT